MLTLAPSDHSPGDSARDRILKAAHRLFYRHGVRAIGVDRLIAESEVAKVTFYRHFPSKDDLVLAFLRDRHEKWMAWFAPGLARVAAANKATGRKNPLPPLADLLAEWFEAPDFRGCAFINVFAELGEASPEVEKLVASHKQEMTAALADLLPPGADRDALAQAAALAVDGAIFHAQLGGADKTTALAALRRLLEALV